MADPRIGTDLGGYRIVDLLGRGGMGVVYVAEHGMLRRRAALKVIAPELADDPVFRERFVDESRLAASIDHPNIVPIYDAREADGSLFIAMRVVDGVDLRTLLQREGPLAPRRALDILAPIGDALDAAHGVGLVHRDVKTANILVEDRTGHPYLTDFGVTKDASSRPGLTRTGQLVGTPEYMAPEQIEGAPVDGRADQYALACVLFEAVSGHTPHERASDIAAMFARVNSEAPDVRDANPDVPIHLADVLRRGLARRPDDRFASCAALMAAVRQALDDAEAATQAVPVAGTLAAAPLAEPPAAAIPTTAAAGRRSGARPLLPAFIAIAVVIALAAGVLAMSMGGNRTAAATPGASASSTLPGTLPPPESALPSPTRILVALPSPSPTDDPFVTAAATVGPGPTGPGPGPTPTRTATARPNTPTPTAPKPPTPTPTIVDTTDPTVGGPPTHVFVQGSQAVQEYQIPVRLAWSGSDAGGSGLKEYVLERRQSTSQGGGAWTEVYRGSATSRTFTLQSRLSNQPAWYTFRVRAIDNAGNSSANATGNDFELYDWQDDNGNWSYSAGCVLESKASALEGHVTSCTQAGATATFSSLSFVSNMAFVFTTGAGYGAVHISVNGNSLGTFSLANDPGARTVVAIRSPGSAIQSTFSVVITTESAEEVEFDAMFVQYGEPT